MATPQQQRRNPNASFRPALRFPTDPHNPGVLPSKIRHIVEGPSPPNGAGPSSAPPPPSAAVNLLQSRRKPWELDLTKLEDVIRTGEVQRKVILVLGDITPSSIEPVVTSTSLQNSLVVIVTPFEANLSIPSNKCVPAVRILRLRPRAEPQRQQPNPKKKIGKAIVPSTTGNGDGGLTEPLTAFRLTTIIEWAERVANAWKSQPVRSQAMFAVLNEGEGPANGVGDDGLDAARSWTKRPNRSNTSLGSDVDSSSGSFVGESSTIVMHGRQRVVHPSKSSSTLQSIPDVEDDEDVGSHQRAHTSLGHGYGDAGRRRPSMDGPYNPSHGATANKTPLVRKRTSFFGRLKLSPSSAPPMPSSSVPTSPRSPTNFISSAAHSFSIGNPTLKSSSSQPSFDAIINFLPSTSATGSAGTLHTNQGQIATQHAASAHAKLLLRQTILITTISQRFLVPVPPRPTVMSLSAMRSDEDVSGEKGRFTRGDGHWKMRTMNVGGRNVAVASQSLVDVGSGVTSGSAARQRRMSRRFSTTIGSIFNGGNGGPTSPATAPPTPPISRPSSEEDDHSAVASRRGSNSSSSPYRSKSKRSVPKLVHVLPFANAQTSLPPPHLMNNTSVNVSAGTARLVRSLEAFLLSWSFGGGSGGNNSRHAGVESVSGSEDDFGSSAGNGGGGVIMGNVRPFLLDLSGLPDILRAATLTPESDDENPSRSHEQVWTVSDIILSGALDDEYACTRIQDEDQLPPSLPVNVPMARLNGRPSTAPPPSPSGMAALGLASPNDDTAWANRRAWIGGMDDLAVYRSPPKSMNGKQSQQDLLLVKRARHQSIRTSLNVASPAEPVPVRSQSTPMLMQKQSPTSWIAPMTTSPPSKPSSKLASSPTSGPGSPISTSTSPTEMEGWENPILGRRSIDAQTTSVIITRPSTDSQNDYPSGSRSPPTRTLPPPTDDSYNRPTVRSASADGRSVQKKQPSRSTQLYPGPGKVAPTPPSSLRHSITPPTPESSHTRNASDGGMALPPRPARATPPSRHNPPLPNFQQHRTSPSSPSPLTMPNTVGNLVVNKELPPPPPSASALPTPPDSASSSSVSNDAVNDNEQQDGEKWKGAGKKKSWWSGGGSRLLKLL